MKIDLKRRILESLYQYKAEMKEQISQGIEQEEGKLEELSVLIVDVERDLQFHTVTRIAKDDIVDAGFDATDIDDDELEEISECVGDLLVGNGSYWDAIVHECQERNIPEVSGKEDMP